MAEENKLAKALKIDGFLAALTPGQKRGLMVGAGVLTTGIIMAALPDGRSANKAQAMQSDIKRSVLTTGSTREIGIDSLNAKVKTVESENTSLKRELDRMNKELTDIKRQRGTDVSVVQELGRMKSQLANLSTQAKDLGWQVDDIKDGYYSVNGEGIDVAALAPQSQPRELPAPQPIVRPVEVVEKEVVAANEFGVENINELFERAPDPMPIPNSTAPVKAGQVQPAMQIFTTDSTSQSTDVSKTQEREAFLPAGSILTGVLLNGLEAPTGKGARKDPYPVLVRIQKEAILPNEFQSDVKGCFATMSGYGELSSERVMLRGETFSCQLKNGDVIETEFPSYAVGESGKAGIRGKLVSRSGQVLAKSAMAGFLSGVSEAFGSTPVPVIQTGTPGAQKTFQDNFSSDTAGYAAGQGAANAMERIADYYLDLADQIFPVIEIANGRKVDIVLTQGFKLEIKDLLIAAKKNGGRKS